MKSPNVWWTLKWNRPSLCSASRFPKGNWATWERLTSPWPCVESQHIIFTTCLFVFTNCYHLLLLLNKICIRGHSNECIMNITAHRYRGLRRNIHQRSPELSFYWSFYCQSQLFRNSLMWAVSVLQYIYWNGMRFQWHIIYRYLGKSNR